ncbi:NAD(P)/FAD-dependent oxidoreductase [SAR86 cluster bacterium]|nr:NAD(P)/FAD-dependent oxidoreductase [SAR86 cluster bacterium]
MKKEIAILGAGPMGLACAFYAIKKGYKVTIFEAAPFAGGMAAHFDFNGLSIEKYYHFMCKSDFDTFQLLDELKISKKLKWRNTSMGYYIDGDLYKWGDPFSLLFFKKFNFLSKIRYGINAFLTGKRKNFDSLEGISAEEWLKKWIGEEAYALTWEKIMHYKFYEYAPKISASWIATRMKRVANSRKSIFQEELGYLEGGSKTLIDAMVIWIKKNGGEIKLAEAVTKIEIFQGTAKGLLTSEKSYDFDQIISTIPTPYLKDILKEAPTDMIIEYSQIENIGVVCVIYKLRKSLSPHFWLNINDSRFEIPGIIEFSNLRKMDNDEKIIYLPFYMPLSNPKFQKDKDFFFRETFAYLKIINPDISEEDILDFSINKLKYAQPICDVDFKKRIPEIKTRINNLYIADTCFYYPEDRGISESTKLAKEIVQNIIK